MRGVDRIRQVELRMSDEPQPTRKSEPAKRSTALYSQASVVGLIGAIASGAAFAQDFSAEPETLAAPALRDPDLADATPAQFFVDGERPRPPAPSDPAAAEEEILFEADEVYRESEDSPVIAEGNVRAYFGGRYLAANRLIYDQSADIVTAEGDVSITDENLETAFAGKVILSGDLRDGVVENFSALLAENARLAAEDAVREKGARTRLRNAVFTSCSVCNDEGEGKTPTWRLKALRVVRDEERRIVRFRHAFFELKGVPILYTPFLQAPDPSVERQSGFLTPVIRANSRLGFNVEVPYYLAISNSQDATFFPKYTSNDGVLWQAEYRRRFDNGYHIVSGGVINFDNTDPELTESEADVPGTRWNVFARGYQDISESLRVGYDVERVSDNTYFRRYNVRRRGDLRKEIETSDTLRLRSGVFANWRVGDVNVRADSYVFQDLRTVAVCDLTTGERLTVGGTSCDRLSGIDPDVVEAPVISDLTPYVLPLVDVRTNVGDIIGGKTSLNVNFASLQRKSGVDSRRLTASAEWSREHITRSGHRLNAFAELRGDLYRFADLDEGTEILAGREGDPTRFEARVIPTVGAEWSYPLTRRAMGARLFIEPRVQLVASLADRNDPDIINEDSQSVEFDYAGLFDPDKSPGFDAVEDGQRLNAGVAASAVFDNGLTIEAEVGEQFRVQTTSAFTPQAVLPDGADLFPAGLGEKRSDIVGALNIRYNRVVGLTNRFRLDDDDGSIQRLESAGFVNVGPVLATGRYTRLNEENASAALEEREELTAGLRLQLTDNWSTGASWRQDLIENQTIRQNFSLAYEDDCSLFELIFSRDLTRDVGLITDNAVLFRFTLRSLVD